MEDGLIASYQRATAEILLEVESWWRVGVPLVEEPDPEWCRYVCARREAEAAMTDAEINRNARMSAWTFFSAFFGSALMVPMAATGGLFWLLIGLALLVFLYAASLWYGLRVLRHRKVVLIWILPILGILAVLLVTLLIDIVRIVIIP